MEIDLVDRESSEIKHQISTQEENHYGIITLPTIKVIRGIVVTTKVLDIPSKFLRAF